MLFIISLIKNKINMKSTWYYFDTKVSTNFSKVFMKIYTKLCTKI